jgi:hypothetical protein
MTDTKRDQLAERVREACLRAAREAWEDGGLRGLCGEGRWEYALGAIETLDLTTITRALPPTPGPREQS